MSGRLKKDDRESDSEHEDESSRDSSRGKSQGEKSPFQRLKSVQQLKDQRRVNAWAVAAARYNAHRLSLAGLPADKQPRLREGGEPMAYCLLLDRVEGIMLPKGLTKRAGRPGGVRLGLSVSLFHARAQRPFGSTWLGEPRALDHPSQARRRPGGAGARPRHGGLGGGGGGGLGGGAGSGKSKVWGPGVPVSSRQGQLLAWVSRLGDPDCLALVEVVATVGGKQYGIGWTYLGLGGEDEGLGDVDDPPAARKGGAAAANQLRSVTLFRGSPRSLLFFTADDWKHVHKTAKPGHTLHYRLRAFSRGLRLRHLLREDQMVGALQVVPGLAPRKVEVAPGVRRAAAVVGAELPEERGALPRPLRPRLAPVHRLELREVVVRVPERAAFERRLLQQLVQDALPVLHREAAPAPGSCFGLFAAKPAKQQTREHTRELRRKGRVVRRRLRVALHNGYTAINDPAPAPDRKRPPPPREGGGGGVLALDLDPAQRQWLAFPLVEDREDEEDDEGEGGGGGGGGGAGGEGEGEEGREDTGGDFLKVAGGPAGGAAAVAVRGFPLHPGVALLAALEYTLEVKARVKRSDRAQDEKPPPPQYLNVCVGLGAFCPWDGKRLRLRNTPARDEDRLGVEAKLQADGRTHYLVPPGTVVYYGKDGLDAAAAGAEEEEGGGRYYDSEEGPEQRMVGFDLRCFDEDGRELPDQTPLRDEDESDLGLSGGEEGKRAGEEEEEDEEGLEESYVVGEAGVSRLRDSVRRRAGGGGGGGGSDDEEWDGWRTGIKVPKDRGSLMGKLLRRPVHVEGGDPPPVRASAPRFSLDARDTAPFLASVSASQGLAEAVAAAMAPTSRDISRATRARLSRHGFTEALQDTLSSRRRRRRGGGDGGDGGDGGAYEAAAFDGPVPELALELKGLPRHEFTFQFAAFRPAQQGPGGPRAPASVFFTFQFYNCAPTKTERLLLRRCPGRRPRPRGEGKGEEEEGAEDPFSAGGPYALVREGRHGRDEPALAAKFVVDTTAMQPREGAALFAYLSGRRLAVTCWDADALLPLGEASVPLRPLLRQGRPAAKLAREYALVAPDGAEAGDRPMALRPGCPPAGQLAGHVQLLACNYGEEGRGTFREEPEVVRPNEEAAARAGLDFRLGSRPFGRGGVGPGERGAAAAGGAAPRRPKHKVRARPLTEASADVRRLLGERAGGVGEGEGEGGGAADAWRRRGRHQRGAADAGVVTYDDVLKLVQRFKSKLPGRVRYAGPLLRLVDAPDARALGGRLAAALHKAAQAAGGGRHALKGLFEQMDLGGDGCVDVQELHEGLALLCGADLTPAAARALLASMDRNGDGRVHMGEFLLWARARMPPPDAAVKLKKVLMVAETRGTDLEKVFAYLDRDGSGSVSLAELEAGLGALGDWARFSPRELRELLRRFDADGSGEISMKEFFAFAGLKYRVVESAEKKLKKVIEKAEAMGTSARDVFGFLDADASGGITVGEFERALRELAGFGALSPKDVADLAKKFDKDGDGTVSLLEFMEYLGKDITEMLEQKLRRVLVKAEERGAYIKDIFDEFDKDKGGSISLEEMEQVLGKLNVFNNVSEEEVRKFLQKLDKDKSGSIEFDEFINFVYPGSTPLERRLRAILRKAEEMGLSVEDAFKHFDKNADGDITRAEFEGGLRKLLPQDMEISDAEMSRLIDKFDKDGDGMVSVEEFLKFMGKDFKTSVEARLHKVVRRLTDQGTPLDVVFEHFRKDSTGQVALEAFAAGVRELPGFGDVGLEEARALGARFDADGDGHLCLREFAAHFAGPRARLEQPRTPLRGGGGGTGPGGRAAAGAAGGGGGGGTAAARAAAAAGPAAAALARLLVGEGGLGAVLKALKQEGGGGGGVLAEAEFEMLLTRLPGLEDLGTQECREFAARFRDGAGGGGGGGVRLAAVEEWARAVAGQEKLPGATALERKLCRVLERFEDKGHSVLQAFDHFDRDGAGRIGREEFLEGLRDLKVLKGAREADVELLVKRLGKNKEGKVSLEAFDQWFRDTKELIIAEEEGGGPGPHDADPSPAAGPGGGLGAPAAEELARKLRGAARRAEGAGLALEQAFGVFDKDLDGTLSEGELREGLEALGLLAEAPGGWAAVAALARRFDFDGGGRVDAAEWVKFLRRPLGEQLGPQGGGGEGGGAGGGDRGTGPGDLLDDANYEYSTDPVTKHAEKKIRRAAQKSSHLDIEGLFKHYDDDGSGTVTRADFVQVLMELGLSLLERDRPPGEGGGPGGGGERTRARQTAQLLAAQHGASRYPPKKRAAAGPRDLRGLRPQDDSEEARYTEQMESLQMIKWYREGQKKDLVQQILTNSLTTEYHIYPRFGQTLWFEHPVTNPLGHEERFRIELDDPELRLVTAGPEWAALRRALPPAVGEVEAGSGVEDDMIDADPVHGFQTTLAARERVLVPFKFLSLNAGRGDKGLPQGRTVAISFVSASHGHIVSLLQVHIHPRPFCVDRSIRFYQHEGEIMKRTIQLLPALAPLAPAEVSSSLASEGGFLAARAFHGPKFVHCVDLGPGGGGGGGGGGRVVAQWRELGADPSSGANRQEIFLKYCCGPFPSVGEFYVLIYGDEFQASLHELWHVSVHSRLRVNLHALTGQAAPAELAVRGDRFARRVMAHSSQPDETEFEPDTPFQLVSGAYNRVALRYRPRATGTCRFQITLVDLDSRELVAAWLAQATASPPTVTKVFDVRAPFQRPTHKKIAYTNPWDQPRVYKLHSSNTSILRPRYKTLEIAAGGQGYIRVWISGSETPEIREVFLFVNDQNDQNEECFLVKIQSV